MQVTGIFIWSFSVPLPPGPILTGSSNFAYNNLIIKWTAPANNTFVTKYRVSIDGATQQTLRHDPEIQFTAKALTPGMNYTVKIVTVSGTTDNVSESSEHIETIRITPTSKKMMCFWIWFKTITKFYCACVFNDRVCATSFASHGYHGWS